MDLAEDLIFKNARRCFRAYAFEIVGIFISFVLLCGACFFWYLSNKSVEERVIFKESKIKENSKKQIFVDIEGSVIKPDVYCVSEGARLKDVLVMAGGLSYKADRSYVARYFNLARKVEDQEKIYIPSKDEVEKGFFADNTNYDLIQNEDNSHINSVCNINTASQKELEELPGIGPVTAKKIISGRPYSQISDLLTKKIIGEKTYEKIRNDITVGNN